MKKKLTIILIVLFALGMLLPASFAWFMDHTTVDIGMNSFVHKSYFESGDGTSAEQFIDGTHGEDDTGCAFEIKYPVQLYYFAWLQYLGYFNKPIGETTTINQTYFYLSADLDMTGWILPPIGTTDYPFVGNFDGNGHTISNLTIQNVNTGHDSDPKTLTDLPVDNITGANIVGFFGVVGSTNADGTVYGAMESNGGFTPSDSESYTYTSETNEVKNFALTNVTVKTEASPSLIGIVAGYVNGEVSNVRVGTSGSVIRTGDVSAIHSDYEIPDNHSNLSDYTLMGYVTSPYKDTSDVVFAKVDTPTEAKSQFNYTAQGASAGFGGSIDMLYTFRRLNAIFSSNGLNRNYSFVQSLDNNGNGDYVTTTKQSKTMVNNEYETSNNTQTLKYWFSELGGSLVGSYNTGGNNRYNFMYGLQRADNTQLTVLLSDSEETVSKEAFTFSKDGQYLTVSNDSFGTTNNPSEATHFYKIPLNDEFGLYYYDGTEVKFMGERNGNLSNVLTMWREDENALISENDYYLRYNNGWSYAQRTLSGYYIKDSSGNYLTESLTVGDISNATLWSFSNYSNLTTTTGSYIYVAGSNNKYLYIQRSSSRPYTYSLTVGNTRQYWQFTNNRLRNRSYTNYYLNRSSTTWNAGTSNLGLEIVPVYNSQTISVNGIGTESIPDSLSIVRRGSYVPITLELTNSSNKESYYSDYRVSDLTNTGYIVGGAYEGKGNTGQGDVRISAFPISSINGSFSNGKVTSLYTFNGSTTPTSINLSNNTYARISSVITNFEQMMSEATQLENAENDSHFVYGLHFMNSTIGMSRLISAEHVKLFDNEYYNYELPESSIDFNVNEKGYVTLLAGDYYTDNKSFFSLHEVVRDPLDETKIINIREISEIYKPYDSDMPYIYKYSDGTYSEALNSTLYSTSPVFNTSWLTNPRNNSTITNNKYLYYFEIPVNKGEYALGSVANKAGAYLVYLDIGANAQLVDRGTVTEDFEEITKTYEIPVGATFQNDPVLTDPVIPSALASLATSTTSNNVTITDDTHITFSNGTVSFIKDGVTVNDLLNVSTIPSPPKNTTTKRIRRTTYYDYNIAKDRYTVTIVEVTKIDNGSISVTINAWNTAYDWDITANTATPIATMANGFTPNIGSNTSNVEINSEESQILEYAEVNDVYCYLINISSDDGAQTLRIDTDALEGNLSIEAELYHFCYAIKDNDDENYGATIDYDYDCTIAFNKDEDTVADMFSFSNREYDISVTPTESINTHVVTPYTGSVYTITLTPTPS